MSYYFGSKDKDVWSPALQTGELFVSASKIISLYLDTPNGLNAIAADYIEIDVDVFEHYTNLFLRTYIKSENKILKMELHPNLLISLAILKKLAVNIESNSEEEKKIIEEAADLSQFMPD